MIASNTLFQQGLAIRNAVAGEKAAAAATTADAFNLPMQELLTEICWGAIWSRPGLDRKSRSILNIGMLAALNRPDELSGHLRAALTNGLSKTEIQECLLQVAVYVGMPAGLNAFKTASKIFEELGM